MVPEYFNKIAYSYFELNGPLWEIKVRGVIPYLFYLKEKIINFHYSFEGQNVLSYKERSLIT